MAADRIEELTATCMANDILITQKDNRITHLEAGIKAVAELINDSQGVYGLHLNGDPSPWDELLQGGIFEEWLVDFSKANEALK
jgi:hypothetical protein